MFPLKQKFLQYLCMSLLVIWKTSASSSHNFLTHVLNPIMQVSIQFPAILEKSEEWSLCNTSSFIDDLNCATHFIPRFIMILDYSRNKWNRKGVGLRIWNFQGYGILVFFFSLLIYYRYWRNSKWIFQGLIKYNMEFQQKITNEWSRKNQVGFPRFSV